MPLEPPDRQHWQAAVGYVELGMFQEANDQLENINPFSRAAPEVSAVRIALYRGLKKWELMREVAKRLAEFQPNDIQWTISLETYTDSAISPYPGTAPLIPQRQPLCVSRSLQGFLC